MEIKDKMFIKVVDEISGASEYYTISTSVDIPSICKKELINLFKERMGKKAKIPDKDLTVKEVFDISYAN